MENLGSDMDRDREAPHGRDLGDEPSMPSVGALLETAQGEIAHHASVRPYTVVLVAVAAGYILGGGLPPWALRLAIGVGTRAVVARVMASVVDGV